MVLKTMHSAVVSSKIIFSSNAVAILVSVSMFHDALQTRNSPKNIHHELYALFNSLLAIFCYNSRNWMKIINL